MSESLKEKYKDTVRCMSDVLTDIANELGIPEAQHGDPDLIFDAIEELKHPKISDAGVTEASHVMAENYGDLPISWEAEMRDAITAYFNVANAKYTT